MASQVATQCRAVTGLAGATSLGSAKSLAANALIVSPIGNRRVHRASRKSSIVAMVPKKKVGLCCFVGRSRSAFFCLSSGTRWQPAMVIASQVQIRPCGRKHHLQADLLCSKVQTQSLHKKDARIQCFSCGSSFSILCIAVRF
jgi:hypothetical protein